MRFKAYDDPHMRKLITMLNAEAQIPTRMAMERDIERCVKHGKEEMKRALAMHTGKFAFTMTTKSENDPLSYDHSFHLGWYAPEIHIILSIPH
jgi:hypothetical protein